MDRLWESRGLYCRGAYVGRPPVYKGIPLSTIYVSGLATCEPLQQKDLSSCDKSFSMMQRHGTHVKLVRLFLKNIENSLHDAPFCSKLSKYATTG